MIKIIDITLYNHYKFSRNYFEDFKMVFSRETRGMSLGEYTYIIQDNDYTERAELLTNLQYIDRKVVRFCDAPKDGGLYGKNNIGIGRPIGVLLIYSAIATTAITFIYYPNKSAIWALIGKK